MPKWTFRDSADRGGKITRGAPAADSKSTLSFEGRHPSALPSNASRWDVVDGVLSLTLRTEPGRRWPAAFAGGEKAFALVTNGLLIWKKGPVVHSESGHGHGYRAVYPVARAQFPDYQVSNRRAFDIASDMHAASIARRPMRLAFPGVAPQAINIVDSVTNDGPKLVGTGHRIERRVARPANGNAAGAAAVLPAGGKHCFNPDPAPDASACPVTVRVVSRKTVSGLAGECSRCLPISRTTLARPALPARTETLRSAWALHRSQWTAGL